MMILVMFLVLVVIAVRAACEVLDEVRGMGATIERAVHAARPRAVCARHPHADVVDALTNDCDVCKHIHSISFTESSCD